MERAMLLQPGRGPDDDAAPSPDRLQLILHRGAKVRHSQGFTFEDVTGLVKWAAADRGVVTLGDLVDIEANAEKLAMLVNDWMTATDE